MWLYGIGCEDGCVRLTHLSKVGDGLRVEMRREGLGLTYWALQHLRGRLAESAAYE